MKLQIAAGDRFGLVHPSIDAHSLGLSSIMELLADCGISTIPALPEINEAVSRAGEPASARLIRDWIRGEGISVLGYSYRLDPDEGLRLFSDFMECLRRIQALATEGGTIRALYFAGLPKTCDLVEARFPGISGLFRGEETRAETLDLLGLPQSLFPETTTTGLAYDEMRLAFGTRLVSEGEYGRVTPIDRSGYGRFGARGDGIAARVAHGAAHGFPPVLRAQVGTFLPDRMEAIALFLEWTAGLARTGLLDVLSIGSSELSQSEFGRDWQGQPDGGGVPINKPEEFSDIWQAARPMLVRSYAGTRDIESMARMLEEKIDSAWHALSLWWFCQTDGRGPNSVAENLRQHVATLKYLAGTGKPFEPDMPPHFSLRGGDDLTYVLSGLIAAKAAKEAGIQRLILQVMLNTPRRTSGLNDLAKARTLLHLVRELEDGDFKVYLQPSAGLDYFSRDPLKAKAQLAAVTALMDDIEPRDSSSPQIIHVVSFSEGHALADPEIVNESLRITRQALLDYRALRESGGIEDLSSKPQVLARTAELLREARLAIAAIEGSIRSPYGAAGLYEILASGFLLAPDLAGRRGEFPAAVRWRTRCIDGAVVAVDEAGFPQPARERIAAAAETAKERAAAGGKNQWRD